MGNSKKKTNEIIEKIEAEKEILATMPKNNKKNIAKYLEKIEQLKKEYTNLLDKSVREMKKRYDNTIDIKSNEEIEKNNAELERISKILVILNDAQTSYEKMGLDKIIYKIDKYYKGNLEDINELIDMAIKKFEEVGIILKLSDFNYSIYVSQYMEVFFEEKNNGKIKSNKIKEKFEEVYWKCSDIIVHIELNLRNIYLSNKNNIDKYFEKEKNSILKQYGKTRKDIKELYSKIQEQRDEKYAQDKKQLLDEFLTGEYSINDFEEEKIKSDYQKVLSTDSYEENQDFQKGILEFLNSLYEYKNYLKFEFIINDIKKYFQEKDKYKNSYKEAKKNVETLEKKIKKINNKNLRKGIFRRVNKEIKQTVEQKQMIAEVRNAYKEMELNKFYNQIYLNVKSDSTVYDVLELANSYYVYLTKCIIENNKTITQNKIDELIQELDKFLKNPYNNIINNITILEENDIAMIIKDRYKLLKFNIDKDDFNGKKVDNMISTLEHIVIDYNLKKANLKIQDIEEILEIKQALKLQ